jgi:hypothetical protein
MLVTLALAEGVVVEDVKCRVEISIKVSSRRKGKRDSMARLSTITMT